NVYVTGHTRSTNFPLQNAFQPIHAPGPSPTGGAGLLNVDVFVTKLAASGSSLMYSTYLGGSSDDDGMDIAVNSANEAYVTGNIYLATDFPTTPGAFRTSDGNSFVTKFSAAGNSLVYSTYLQGTSNSIALNTSGNAYVTGEQSRTIGRRAQVVKLNPNGDSLDFSFAFGGTEAAFDPSLASQQGRGIAVDPSGSAYIHGDVFANNFPTSAGAFQPNLTTNLCNPDFCGDSFVTKIGSGTGFTISGRVTGVNGNGLSNVKMSLTGSLKMVVTTNANGDYSFPFLLPNGNFTVTPTRNFFTFAPTNQVFNSLSGDQTADFVGTIPNVTISGAVKNANNVGVSGVTVTLSGAQSGSFVTDSSGFYSFSNLPSGNTYTVTPSRGTDVFDPPSTTIVQIGDNQIVNFKLVYQISGQVTNAGGTPTQDVTLTLSGTQSGVTKTDAVGNYVFTNLGANGNYTVTPSKEGILIYNFTPVSQNYSNLTGNQVANFSFTNSTNAALFPIADAYVEDGANAAANFGTVTPMLLKSTNQTGQRRDVYLKYDLSTVSRKITNAKLRIFAGLSAAGSVGTSVFGVANTSWLENTINWNNKPAQSAITGATATVTSTTFATYDLDITSYILSEQNAGRDVISVALHNASNSTPHILVNSREAA
ncbi:MAG TPA: carboxypeptidase regulatory-like domain-containing protein, partial [Pyrinomonadaceae bacterium]|nr:carboxypeptidase regulatory-like domain-containing protein [Pyrinomonadaceae bacterium]